MVSDDVIIPEHKTVSSQWEKNEVIRKAHDRARVLVLPRLINILEQHTGDNVWVASADLFGTQSSLELWTKPDYLAVHDATSFAKDDPDNMPDIHGTATQLFLEKQEEQRMGQSSLGKTKTRKDLPKKCLLRHERSPEKYWFMVCKLRRRHQKEIAKLPSLSSSTQPPSSSAVLDELVRSAIFKHGDKSFNSGQKVLDRALEPFAKDIAGDTRQCNDAAELPDPNSDRHPTTRFAMEASALQLETIKIVTDALSIVRDAKNLKVGVVPKTTVVRWKEEDEFEIRYFT